MPYLASQNRYQTMQELSDDVERVVGGGWIA